MNEDFVSFEIANKLKEKGFPQVKIGTLAMYNEEGEWYSLARNLDEFEYLFEDFDYHDCVCPTISQVLKWLREEKRLHIEIRLFCVGYGFDIIRISDRKKLAWSGTTERASYEQAALAGIEYILDNLI
jgi:hypothetical protein